MPASVILLFCVGAALIALFIGFRVHLTRSREGKMLTFVALFALPIMAAWAGFSEQMDRAESTKFCLSCHIMDDFGMSLHIDDPSYIPAAHYQNNRVPRDEACFTCHTNYTMFGDYKAKLRGLRHVYVNYIVTIPKQIKLYDPYNNRECLHCHAGARNFEANDVHQSVRAELGKNSTSCLECHD